MRRLLTSALLIFVGVATGGYLFRDVQPRSFLALTDCRHSCYRVNDLAGLLASAGIQRASGALPLVVRETNGCITIRHPFPVFEAVSKSVVSVHVYEGRPGARKRMSLGSAVVIGRGRVLTNCHVLARTGTQAQVWIRHNFDLPADRRSIDTPLSRVLLAEIDCAGARWTLRHAATYAEHFAGGRRLSADDLHPTDADYRPTTPGGIRDTVRSAACR